MKTLALAGCSFSDVIDYEDNYSPYGLLCAEYLGLKYLHFARQAGSNPRSIYKLVRAIIDGVVVSGDIIILQPTNPDRKFVGSVPPEEKPPSHNAPGRVETHNAIWDDEVIYSTDLKRKSHTWQIEKVNQEYHKAFDNYPEQSAFDYDVFLTQIVMLESLCRHRNIHLVLLTGRYIFEPGIRQVCDEVTNNMIFNETQVIITGDADEPSEHDLGYDSTIRNEYDNTHLSPLGHEILAKALTEHIKENIND